MGRFSANTRGQYMGVGPKLSSSFVDTSVTPSPPNPDPLKYTIINIEKMGAVIILEVKYDGCTTYEGHKILLYHKTTIEALWRQGSLDPHFSTKGGYISPIARFAPTDLGREMAGHLAEEYQ